MGCKYHYPRNGSYYISYISSYSQVENSDFEDLEIMEAKPPKWMIFDIIRGIEKEVN